MYDLELMRRLATGGVAGGAATESEALAARDAREFDEGGEAGALESRGAAHDIPLLDDAGVRALISQDARDAVIGFEVTSEAVYRRRYNRAIAPVRRLRYKKQLQIAFQVSTASKPN